MNVGQTAGFNFNRKLIVSPVTSFNNVCKQAINNWSSKNPDREEKIWEKEMDRRYGKR